MTEKQPKPETFYLECRCNSDVEGEPNNKVLNNSYTYKSETIIMNFQYCDEHRQEIEAVIDGLF